MRTVNRGSGCERHLIPGHWKNVHCCALIVQQTASCFVPHAITIRGISRWYPLTSKPCLNMKPWGEASLWPHGPGLVMSLTFIVELNCLVKWVLEQFMCNFPRKKAIGLKYIMCVCEVASLCLTLWPVPGGSLARQAPLSMEFSRQKSWRGLPCPPPGDLPNPGVEPVFLMSPALAGGFFTTSATWEAH